MGTCTCKVASDQEAHHHDHQPMHVAGVRLHPSLTRRLAQVTGYVEVHLEQGPVLEVAGQPLGVVSSIAGQTRLAVSMLGIQVRCLLQYLTGNHFICSIPGHLACVCVCACASVCTCVGAWNVGQRSNRILFPAIETHFLSH